MTTHNFKKGQKVRAKVYEDSEWVYGEFYKYNHNNYYPYTVNSNTSNNCYRLCEPVEETEEWIPKEGELIEVSEDGEYNEYSYLNSVFFLCKTEQGYWIKESKNDNKAYLWKSARPIQKEDEQAEETILPTGKNDKKPIERMTEIYEEEKKKIPLNKWNSWYSQECRILGIAKFLDEFVQEINERFNNLTK